ANEANMKYLHERQINGYVPDNRFRSRDPKFQNQKDKYGKRRQNQPGTDWKNIIPASEFQFDPVNLTCICPAGESLKYHATRTDQNGQSRAYFQGRLMQCRNCP
ncbi:IS1182 family transposase, partial [Marinobacter alexandrii]|nr:IS1182 family transposase [Marinobacter alexandrii]